MIKLKLKHKHSSERRVKIVTSGFRARPSRKRTLFDQIHHQPDPNGRERHRDYTSIEFYILGWAHAIAKIDPRWAFQQLGRYDREALLDDSVSKYFILNEEQKKFAWFAHSKIVEGRIKLRNEAQQQLIKDLREQERQVKPFDEIAPSKSPAEINPDLITDPAKLAERFNNETISALLVPQEGVFDSKKVRVVYGGARPNLGANLSDEEQGRIKRAFSTIPPGSRLSRKRVRES